MRLEKNLPSQLQDARVVGGVDKQEAAAVKHVRRRVDGVGARSAASGESAKLRVIEHIEGFRTEFKSNTLVDGNMLK
jgi:hypothetical protein